MKGCLPAMGYSFAAGTTDGPGEFDFRQGTQTGNKLWDSVRDLIAQPTAEDVKCQHPKPILLAAGRVSKVIKTNFDHTIIKFDGRLLFR